MFAVLLIFYL